MAVAAARSPGSRAWRPLLEVLRAPLLPSPIADVVAGWSLASALAAPSSEAPAAAVGSLVVACLMGCCLLAAGMAQNALADRDDDRRRKPERPLPRGAVSSRQVRLLFACLTGTALLLGVVWPALLPWVVAIVVLTALYHYVFKRQRVLGCLALGALRALDMGLGVVAAGAAAVGPLPLIVCGAYGLYITGASLHASTDDEDGSSPWSQRGLGLALAVLTAGAVAALVLLVREGALQVLSLGLLLLAGGRLVSAWRRKPPPVVTGVALSNLYLLGAAVTLASGRLVAGAVVLALFGASRMLLRVFPPS